MARPTLSELTEQTIGDMASRTEGAAFLQYAIERVFGPVLAGVAHELHGEVEYNRLQLYPTTADAEHLGYWGAMLDTPRKGGQRAMGAVYLSETDSSVLLESGTRLVSDAGQIYVTVDDSWIVGGSPVTVAALEPGSSANLIEGMLHFEAPVPGLPPDAPITESIEGGTDLEDLEDYRARVVSAMRATLPYGGPGDYERWALSREGVARAWEFPNRAGLGTVSLSFLLGPSIIPSSADVAAMQTFLDSVRPVDMRAVYVRAPVAKPVDITLTLEPPSPEVAYEVRYELESLFSEAGLEESMPRSRIDEAISRAAGETSHEITAISSLVPSTWELLTLGNLTFSNVSI